MSNGKIQYSVKLLEEQLSKNKRELEFWKSNLSSKDPLVVRQAQGNIGGCETRIEDLTAGLAILNPPFSLSASSTPKVDKPKKEEAVTAHVVREAMKAVAHEVRAPKAVRDGLVKRPSRIHLDFKSIGKKYGHNVKLIQSHVVENEEAVIAAIQKDGKYDFSLGETPVSLEAAEVQITVV
jgi:hypothetical protein